MPPVPVQQFSEVRSAVKEIEPLLKGRLPRPWALVQYWHSVEPTEAHVAAPKIFTLAMIAAELIRGYPGGCVGIWLCSGLGLRPTELYSLCWRHVSPPRDRLDYSVSLFATIVVPKAGCSGAKHNTRESKTMIS